MTKEQAKQRVLDAVADLAQVDHLSMVEYLAYLGEVSAAVEDAFDRLAVAEVIHSDEEVEPATAADLNLTGAEADDLNARAAERSEGCGLGCGSACSGFGPADHVHDDDREE